jgi:hypothetical protein
MISRYGAILLDLEAAFTTSLAGAPPPSEVVGQRDKRGEEAHEIMWPDFFDHDFKIMIERIRALQVSGVEKKFARIWQTLEAFDQASDAAVENMTADGEYEPLHEETMNAERSRLANEIRALHQHVRDEVEELQFLRIAPEDSKLIDSGRPLFGDDVFNRFYIANDDIAEAGKCLALQRGTATVFHLMRVLESGLKALGAELGIPYAPSWEAYVRQLEKILDGANFTKLTDQQKAKRHFYQDILGDIISVKSAWRNPTMHIVRHYDPEQARVIFEAVKALMQHLARELSAPPSSEPISTGQSSI